MFEELVGQCVRDLRFENDGSKLIIKTETMVAPINQ